MNDKMPDDSVWEAPSPLSPKSATHQLAPSEPAGQATLHAPEPTLAARTDPRQQPWLSSHPAGLIPLRPMDFGTILGTPYRALRRNPRVSLGTSLLVSSATSLLTLAVIWLVGSAVFGGMDLTAFLSSGEEPTAAVAQKLTGGMAAVTLSLVVPLLISNFASVVMQGLLSLEISRQLLDEKLRLGQLWARVRSRVGALVGAGALYLAGVILYSIVAAVVLIVGITVGSASNNYTLAIIAGVLLALGSPVLAVWLVARLAFVPSIITIEQRGVFASLKRSWLLSRGAFGRTFGTLALVVLIVNVASGIVQIPVQFASGLVGSIFAPTGDPTVTIATIIGSNLVGLVLSTVIGAISLVIISGTTALLYIDRRMRVEGLDLELAHYVELRQSGARVPAVGLVGTSVTADPYAPRA